MASVSVELASQGPLQDVKRHFEPFEDASHINLDCPLFKLPWHAVSSHREFFWEVLGALRPVPSVAEHVMRALDRLGPGPFNFLHLKVEREWRDFCDRCGRAQ